MLVYSATKDRFLEDVRENRISEVIESEIRRKMNKNSPRGEILSWQNSLGYMFRILVDPEIPGSAGVAIEYNIPLTNRRVDFILTGKNELRQDAAVIIELKQWSEVEKTSKDGVVETFLGGGVRETSHPSYQAWSYAALIQDYNETVRQENIHLHPCAYLHNLRSTTAVNDPFYTEHTLRAPVFISKDARKLSEFLKRFVKYGDSDNIMYRIEHGAIKPSKTLADSLASMLQGNPEFILLDEQKVVFETALDMAHRTKNGTKQVLIIEGGPGTGKSVVAINLLVELTKREMLVQYVTKNAAPRAVFKSKLTGTIKKTNIDNLFKGSGGYFEAESDLFDALVIDEAHRLNEKSGLYGNLGENQIKELIACSKASFFFIDEDQRVTLQDIGTINSIEEFAAASGASVQRLRLDSQFRCNGSDGYIAWLDNVLQIRETANPDLEGIDYDFRVFDSPVDLRKAIVRRNAATNRARIVAGYCWDWASKKNSSAFDIVMPEFGFEAQWNLTKDGSLWLVSETSINEVGCIHTCQGLEVDYIGVIIGDDLIVRDGVVQTNGLKRSRMDRSIRGLKTLLKKDRKATEELADRIIKNTYRTLMTRGLKGCYLFCTDQETREYFKSFLVQSRAKSSTSQYESNAPADIPEGIGYEGIPYPVVSFEDAKPYQGYVPIFDLAAAAGSFSAEQEVESFDWIRLPEEFATREGMFVVRVVGESMNKRIPNGSWCLFKATPGGTRNGKVVLVQHRDIEDPDYGGKFTVKRYRSDKREIDDELVNSRVVLSPETHSAGYAEIVLEGDDVGDLTVIGEFTAVLG